jgi:hypothetical protein
MSQELFGAVIAYALIPIYVFGLLILVAMIGRTQLGLFPSRHKQASNGHQPFSLPEYGFVIGLLVLFIIMTTITRRRGL